MKKRRKLVCFDRMHVFHGILVLIILQGCSRGPTHVPEAPPEAVETVIEGLRDHQPQVVWHAMPPSYQSDVRDVLVAFSDEMDSDVYDRGFRILSKVVRVMKEKEDLIANSPVILSMPMLESRIGEHWGETVSFLDTIAQSDISSLEKLRTMDPAKFLATTGHRVMDSMEKFRESMQRKPGKDPWELISASLKKSKIEFVTTDDNHGLLTFGTSTNETTREVKLTKVEGRWVPSEMAERWPERISKVLEDMDRLSGTEFEKVKPMITMVMGALEGAVDALLRADTQKQFDETLKGLASIGAMVRSMQPSR